MNLIAAAVAPRIEIHWSAAYFGLALILLIAFGFGRELMYWRGRPVSWAQRVVSVLITGILISFAYGFVVRDGYLLLRLLVYVMPVMLVLWVLLWYWRYLDVMRMRDEIDADRIKLLLEARKLGYKGPLGLKDEPGEPPDEAQEEKKES